MGVDVPPGAVIILGVLSRDRWYSANEICRETNSPRLLVYESLESGELPALRRGRKWLIPGGSAIDWIEGFARDGHRSDAPTTHDADLEAEKASVPDIAHTLMPERRDRRHDESRVQHQDVGPAL